MTTERQSWRISREVRLGELLTMLVLVITMLGLARKSELRVVGLEVATRANAESISRLTAIVDRDHDLLVKHDALQQGGQ